MTAMKHGIMTIVGAVMLTALSSADLTMQERPDFSGKWAVEPITTPLSTGGPPTRPDQGRLALGDMGSGWGSPITITQDATQLVIESAVFNSYDAAAQPRMRFALHGSETSNTVMLSHTAQVRRSRAAWDGQTLRITTQYPGIDPASGKPFTSDVTHRLRLESPTMLIVEVTRSAPLGARTHLPRDDRPPAQPAARDPR